MLDNTATSDAQVRVRFHRPPPALQACVTTFYLTEITVGPQPRDPQAPMPRITDWLHPEWANLRMVSGDLPITEMAGPEQDGTVDAFVTGPSSITARFTMGTSRIWGVGFLPLGWARFVSGLAERHSGRKKAVSAHDFADHVHDIRSEPAFAAFVPLAESLFGPEPDPSAELARIEAFFAGNMDIEVPDEARILAAHAALLDEDVATVAQMAEASGLPAHTLERVCRRHFGFPPRLLLRRQRFMRSLTQYMLDPKMTWIGALDGHYHDQAQFVRDFHAFMRMSPSEYAALPHPVLGAVMRARQVTEGSAVQALHPLTLGMIGSAGRVARDSN